MNEIEKFNLENAANTSIIKDLKELLNTLTLEDLKHIGDLFLVRRLSNKRKKEVVEIIYKTLTNTTKLSEVFARLIDTEFNLLKRLMKNQGTLQDNNINIQDYHFLYMVGIVFLFKRNNKFYISITNDVYNTIKKIDLFKFDKAIETNTKSYNLVKAMVELYGVVSENDYIDAYNKYYGYIDYFDIPRETLYFCERVDHIYQVYIENELYFIDSILSHKEYEPILEEIIQRQYEISKKPISLNELLKYTDYNYYEENESIKKFKKYLKTKNISKNNIENLLKDIVKAYRLGNQFIGYSIQLLEEYGLNINDNTIQTYMSYLIDIFNNSKIWINNGWTPIELLKKQTKINNENKKNDIKTDIEKYLIKKGKADLASSLKNIDKKIIKKVLKDKALDDIDELKEYIVDTFEFCLDNAKDDIFTQKYFQELIDNENTDTITAYPSDIESFFVFIYKDGNHYSYYIADEIKDLIKKILKIK